MCRPPLEPTSCSRRSTDRQALTHITVSMLEITSWIFLSRVGRSGKGQLMYTSLFSHPQRKKSQGVRSGERAGQWTARRSPRVLVSKSCVMKSLTSLLMWALAPSCMKVIAKGSRSLVAQQLKSSGAKNRLNMSK